MEIHQKTDIVIDPTITGEVLLVVRNSDIDHSFILFVSGLIIYNAYIITLYMCTINIYVVII